MSLSRISAVLMVRDAEATLAATLDGLKRFGEVVISTMGRGTLPLRSPVAIPT